jgi:hypothetical protein
MPDWLVEGDPTLYFVLACALATFGVLWWRTRKRKYAVAAGVAGLLIAGAYLLDRAVESDREQMIRKVYEVAEAVTDNDIDRAFRHVSDSFSKHGRDKTSFREFARDVRRRGVVDAVRVWDVAPDEVSREQRRAVVSFAFKVRGSFGETPPNYFAKVTFVLDPDGQWRVQTFDVFTPLSESKSPVSIPGWGR